MKKVWIFGDSYADERTKNDNTYECWATQLRSECDITNFAVGGSGPDYQLQLLLAEIDKLSANELKEISLIFLISDIFRFNFSFFKPAQQTTSLSIFHNIMPQKATSLQKHFIKLFFEHYIRSSTFEKTEVLKIIGFLKLHSNLFEKVLVWSIFENPAITIKNTDNFYVVSDLSLGLIDEHLDIDPRNNHLSKKNTVVMHEQILNWITKNKEIDTKAFDITYKPRQKNKNFFLFKKVKKT